MRIPLLAIPSILILLAQAASAQGESWGKVGTAVTNQDLLSVAFGNADVGLAVGNAGTILRTTDGAKTWSSVNHGKTTENLWQVAFASPEVAVATGGAGTILRSEDGGATWSRIEQTRTNAILSALAFSSATLGHAMGFAAQLSLRTQDAGKTWDTIHTPTVAYMLGMDFDGDIGLAAGGNGTVLRTGNGGTTWALLSPSPTTTELRSVHLHGKLAIATGAAGTLVRSTDAGLTWTKISGLGIQHVNASAFKDTSMGVVVNFAGGVYRTTDGGQAWTPTPTGHTSNNLMDVAFVGSEVIVAVGISGTILRSPPVSSSILPQIRPKRSWSGRARFRDFLGRFLPGNP